MADPPETAPVVEQPSAQPEAAADEAPKEEAGEVAAAGGGWGSWGLGLISQPHLLEQGLAGVASQVAQVGRLAPYYLARREPKL
jgi:hypothetical protein